MARATDGNAGRMKLGTIRAPAGRNGESNGWYFRKELGGSELPDEGITKKGKKAGKQASKQERKKKTEERRMKKEDREKSESLQSVAAGGAGILRLRPR